MTFLALFSPYRLDSISTGNTWPDFYSGRSMGYGCLVNRLLKFYCGCVFECNCLLSLFSSELGIPSGNCCGKSGTTGAAAVVETASGVNVNCCFIT